MNPIIRAEKLTHIYGEGTPFVKTAIDNIDLDIFQGEYIGVIGKTGSGKSTLIQHFNGILKPSSGKLYYDGEDCWKKGFSLRNLRFNVGLVFQYPEHQLFEETVAKDIAYGPKNMNLTQDEIDRRVKDALEFVGLDGSFREKSPFELSGGQRRRIAIAGIMAMEPKVLILDEPTAGLDPRGRDEILSNITRYRKEKNITVLLVSHNMEDIAKNCEKVLVMNDSKIAMFATVKEVFEHSSALRSMGLNVPQITRIFLSLKENGFNVPASVYTPEQACDAVMDVLEGNV